MRDSDPLLKEVMKVYEQSSGRKSSPQYLRKAQLTLSPERLEDNPLKIANRCSQLQSRRTWLNKVEQDTQVFSFNTQIQNLKPSRRYEREESPEGKLRMLDDLVNKASSQLAKDDSNKKRLKCSRLDSNIKVFKKDSDEKLKEE